MKDILTKQDKIFVREVITTGNKTQSAIKAYGKTNNYNSARVKGHKQLTRVNIQKAIKSIADSIPNDLLVKRHKELLNKREYNKVDKEMIEAPDTQAVSKGLDMAYRIKGLYLNDESISNKTLIINITGETANRYGIAKTT